MNRQKLDEGDIFYLNTNKYRVEAVGNTGITAKTLGVMANQYTYFSFDTINSEESLCIKKRTLLQWIKIN